MICSIVLNWVSMVIEWMCTCEWRWPWRLVAPEFSEAGTTGDSEPSDPGARTVLGSSAKATHTGNHEGKAGPLTRCRSSVKTFSTQNYNFSRISHKYYIYIIYSSFSHQITIIIVDMYMYMHTHAHARAHRHRGRIY